MEPEKSFRLADGRVMPAVGIGVYRSRSLTQKSVETALSLGYRLIDTAAIYGNEYAVGQAIRASGIPREEIFVTSKLWNNDQLRGTQYEACLASLDRLGLDYLDLYLIHWPVGRDLESWRIMEQLYTSGRLRTLGVSNFGIPELKRLLSCCELYPMVNQLEIHPFCQQKELRKFCVENEIQCEAWSPFCRGRIFDHPVLRRIAEKHQRSIAQIVLRWDNQNGVIAIPQAVDPKLIEDNIRIFDFELSEAEMAEIDALDTGKTLAFAGPEEFESAVSGKKAEKGAPKK